MNLLTYYCLIIIIINYLINDDNNENFNADGINDYINIGSIYIELN